ncbi:MAG: dihydroorotate oxidase [Thermoprotei archaeon]
MSKTRDQIHRNVLQHDGFSRVKYSSLRIIENKRLSKTLYLVRTGLLNPIAEPLPPQFANVWIPGYESIPLSIAWYSGNEVWFIVKPVGETTRKLVELGRGEYIGLYGPLGKPLLPPSGYKYLLLAGGSGLAVISHYLQKLCRDGKSCDAVYGAWSYEDIGVVPEYIRSLGGNPVTACLDKECDIVGVVSDYLEHVDLWDYDYVIACGPQAMIRDIVRKARKRGYDRVVLVLESMIKCGLGLCGSCKIGVNSLFLCIDGPGFYITQLDGFIEGDLHG